MGKYDHIPKLLGSENYVGWSTKMQYALACKDLWCHVNNKPDPADLLGQPLHIPVATDPLNVTPTEKVLMCVWLLDDMKAKNLITCHLSPLVSALISHAHTTTAQKAQDTLKEHYNCNDISSQYQICQQLQVLHMKDSADASNFIGQHAALQERLIDLGAPYSDADTLFNLLMGLPPTPIWQQYKSQLEQHMHDNQLAVASASMPTLPTFTFESCMSHITTAAACHINVQLIQSTWPSSEYANAVTTPSMSTNVNAITRLQKHKHNPQGVFCTMASCNKGDHDHAHCYKKGGGMEGQAPWQKKMSEPETVAVATTAPVLPAASTASAVTSPQITAVVASLASLYNNVSFASIAEIPNHAVTCALPLPFSVILDSGTTVTLVKDHKLFHTYSTEDPVSIKTINHSVIQTVGCGIYVAWLTIGGQWMRLRMSNCLHSPDALLNLISVSSMNMKGWDINFCANMTCELSYHNILLGAIPTTGKLDAPDLEFVCHEPSLPPVPELEIATFTHVPLSLDLWHACVGHIGKAAMTQLLQIAKGVAVDSSAPLSHCESCILAKHPHQPFHSSKTE
jgi:hypothetical protein